MATMISGLGGASGYGEQSFRSAAITGTLDDGFAAVNISSVFGAEGVNINGTAFQSIFISSNGLITFQSGVTTPSGTSLTALGQPSLAPFWTDTDINRGGDIFWDLDASTGRVTITWLNVAAKVGPGTNSFQVVLTATGGGDVSVDYIYQTIGYTAGAATQARAGFSNGVTQTLMPGSGSAATLSTYANANFGTNDPAGIYGYGFEAGVGFAGDGVVEGTAGNDSIFIGYTGDPDGDRIDAGDTTGFGGTTGNGDVIDAGAGDDAVGGNYGNDLIFGGAGRDSLQGWYGGDTVDGGTENDTIDGGGGNDSLIGGAGDDTLMGGSAFAPVTFTPSYVEITAPTQQVTGSGERANFAVRSVSSDGTLGTATNGSVTGFRIGNLAATETHTHTASSQISGGQVLFNGLDTGEAITIQIDGVAVNLNTAIANGSVSFNGGGVYGINASGQIVRISGTTANPTTVGNLTVNIPYTSLSVGAAGPSAVTGDSGFFYEYLVNTQPQNVAAEAGGNDSLFGGDGSDSLTGGDGNDLLDGGIGNDSILTGDGNDTVFGGDGDDMIDDAPGVVTLVGADLVFGGQGNDLIWDGSGNDVYFGGLGNDSLWGDSAGDDAFDGNEGNDSIFGGLGNDTLLGGAGIDSLSGALGNDVLDGGAGADSLFGDDGDDSFALTGSFGADTISGGEAGETAGDLLNGAALTSNTTLTLTGAESGTLADGTSTASFTQVERFALGSGNDRAQGWGTNDSIDGGAGDDSLTGGAGADSLDGGSGNDVVNGGSGNDSIGGGAGNDSLTGWSGSDVLFGGDGEDSITGDGDAGVGESAQLITNGNFSNGLTGWTVLNPSGGQAPIVYGWGAPANNAAALNNNDEGVYGDGIQQSITTAPGEVYDLSMLLSENGNGTANHTVVVSVLDASGNVIASQTYVITNGSSQTLTFAFTATTGTSTIRFVNTTSTGTTSTDLMVDNVSVIGRTSLIWNDTISGGGGNDLITGGFGIDLVQGDEGNDTLSGDDGDDSVFGGAGNDALTGGIGADALNGGAGDDGFALSGSFGNDTITGGETDETLGDIVTAAGVTANITLTFTGAEVGTLTDGASTVSFAEVERFELGSGNDTAFGNLGNESIDGGAGNDSLSGAAGNDSLAGGVGADTLFGDAGNDLLDGGVGNDTVFTGEGNDTVFGGDGDDVIDDAVGQPIFAGNDFIDAGDGNDRVFDGSGNDTIFGGSGNDTILGTNIGDDILDGGVGSDSVVGGAGNDVLLGGADADTVLGGTGNDTLLGGAGADSLTGGDGDDVLYGDVQTGGTSADGADTLVGGDGNDQIFLNPNATLAGGHAFGGAGNDAVTGSGLADFIDAGTGDDTVDAGAGADDVLAGDGNDIVFGGAGNDSLQPGLGDDLVFGGAGDDWVNADMGNDTIYGGDGNDRTTLANDGDDLIFGGAGNDQLSGGAGNDTISGDAGADTLLGGDGDDSFALGAGFGADSITGGEAAQTQGDRVDATTLTTNITLTFTGAEAGTISDGTSSASFAEIERFALGSGNDTVFGGAGNEAVSAGVGDDSLIGAGGNDLLDGGSGNDRLFGGDGADTITAGIGNDSIFGGSFGDLVDGGENAGDFDQLDLSNWGWRQTNIIYDAGNPESGVVEFLDLSGAVLGTMQFSNIEKVTPCFTPGTLITTLQGEVPVEDLQPGDKVLTRDHGFRPLIWTGRRDLTVAELVANPALRPIQIAAGALGFGLPQRDMVVSPQHRMLIEGYRAEMLFGEPEVLVAARHLMDLPGINVAFRPGVSYIHVMFDRHEIIRADGAWTESFLPARPMLDSMDGEQAEEIRALFPDLLTAEIAFPASRLSLKAHEARVLLAA